MFGFRGRWLGVVCCRIESMSTEIGANAEEVAAKYLESKGYKVMARNWRRPNCEIDVVASKKVSKNPLNKEKVIYFVEVKYRGNQDQGSGLDYITSGKLKQMRFAGQMWVSENDWHGSWELSAIEVAGSEFEVVKFIDNIVA